jgi:branched-subunit amino acid ABC-type transport system permease component
VLAFSAPNFVLIQGVFYGLGYGLLALGLVLVYRTNRVLNFAQGQIGVIAAVFLVKLTADFHFNYWFGLVLSIAWPRGSAPCPSSCCAGSSARPRVLVMVATIGLS